MINKNQFIEDLSNRSGLPKYKTKIFVNALIDLFADYMMNEETLMITNLFRAEVTTYKGHYGRNPHSKNKEKIWIPDYKKIKITPSPHIDKLIKSKDSLEKETEDE